MKKSTTVWIVVIIIILVLIAIYIAYSGSDNYAPVTQPVTTAPVTEPTTPTTPTTPAPIVVLGTSSSATLGTFLVASNGMALYKYSKDTSGVSNCSGSCATAWPPYSVSSATGLAGAAGVSGSISTITRADGTMQVTYNGMPLYYFQSDSQAGIPTGQNVGGFSVVKP